MKLASRFFISLFIFSTYSQVAHSKLLDKIVGIVDNNIITQSQVNRLKSNLPIKKNMAPLIYAKDAYSSEEMLNITINKYIIKAKLAEIGYTITDDQVEAQINQSQQRSGLDKNALITFLKQQGTSYDEYFETLREAIEFSHFVNRVIQPLISISDQDIKNTFYKTNASKMRMNFKYTLINYIIPKEFVNSARKKDMPSVISTYRSNGILPSDFSKVDFIDLEDIAEDGLNEQIKKVLAKTDEGAVSDVLEINNQYHVFYVAKKDLVESEGYLREKDRIRDNLFEKAVKEETQLWLERQRNKHYIKISL